MSVRPLTYLSVCSGIEAASVAWGPLGWQALGFAEVDAFPSAVLAHHYPDVPNFGDLNGFETWPLCGRPDVLVGGTPCQSFSQAGKRAGLDDPRGQLSLRFIELAERFWLRWVIWENVPGVFSAASHLAPDMDEPDASLAMGEVYEQLETDESYAAEELHGFNSLLAGFSDIGYYGAYRRFDAQYFRLAQRRKRVFAVFYLGDWRPPAGVLFEPEGLRGDIAPRRETGQAAPTLPGRRTAGGGLGTDFDCDGGLICSDEVSPTLRAQGNHSYRMDSQAVVASTGDVAHCLNAGGMGRQDYETETLIAHTLRGEGFDASEDGTGRGTPLVPFDTTQITSAVNGSSPKPGDPCHPLAAGAHAPAIAFEARQEMAVHGDCSGTLTTGHPQGQAVAYDLRGRAGGAQIEGPHDTANIRAGSGGASRSFVAGSFVRRLTPTECERLQGFPDGYTNVPWKGKPTAPDSHRYKALGNSMAVPVMRWLGDRIGLMTDVLDELGRA